MQKAPHTQPLPCASSPLKKIKMLNPLCTKSRIVVLGNHEDHAWTKSERYAPVLHPDTMRLMVSMAVKWQCTLKQGDCKNAFCQGILPDNKITILNTQIGDPNAEKDKYWLLKCTLYGLRRSPRHWYTKIKAIFKSLGLKDITSDPCLFAGNITNPTNPAAAPSSAPLTLGIYVNDFVYFLEDPEVERRFEQLLAGMVTVKFMGNVDWFLGTNF
jgi:hypothetical protein